MTTTTAHEAHSLPCGHCGAPLPVNPLAAWAYCPRCQRPTAVPDSLRAAALSYQQAVHDAWQLRRAREREAVDARAEAGRLESARKPLDLLVLFLLAMEVVPLFGTVLVLALSVVPALFAGQPVGVQVGAVITVIGAGMAIGTIIVKLTLDWARGGRHRRRRDAAGGALPVMTAAAFRVAPPVPGGEAASCGVCGGPLGFRVGEQRVTCGHCGSVLTPCTGTRRHLVKLALREADAALWERARAERQKRRAESGMAARRQQLFLIMAFGGMCMVPVVLAGWAFMLAVRRITFGVEDLLDEFAVGIGADIDRGEEPMVAWLDDYWIDQEPEILRAKDSLLGVRWSVSFWYAGRPALLTVLSDWSDGRADTIALLYAHPADRAGGHAAHSAAAEQARALGYLVEPSRAGIALTASRLPAAALGAHNLHALVAAAHGLAAVGSPGR